MYDSFVKHFLSRLLLNTLYTKNQPKTGKRMDLDYNLLVNTLFTEWLKSSLETIIFCMSSKQIMWFQFSLFWTVITFSFWVIIPPQILKLIARLLSSINLNFGNRYIKEYQYLATNIISSTGNNCVYVECVNWNTIWRVCQVIAQIHIQSKYSYNIVSSHTLSCWCFEHKLIQLLCDRVVNIRKSTAIGLMIATRTASHHRLTN